MSLRRELLFSSADAVLARVFPNQMSYSREDDMEWSRGVARILAALTVVLLPLGSVALAGCRASPEGYAQRREK